MSLQKVLINGRWRDSETPTGSIQAINPANKTILPEIFPVSGASDVESVLQAAHKTIEELRAIPNVVVKIAGFLERYASGIEANSEELVELANQETGLAREPRLRNVELPRTTNQLRQAANAAISYSWCLPTIDTKNNIRSRYGSLGGPVVVFGPNNFPYAFNSVSGGDFAAAIAAGNPVIAKANPGHPATTRRLAEIAFEAVQDEGLPLSMLQLLYHVEPQEGLKLVSDQRVGASGFTGSRNGGLALKTAADKAGKPIYLEMSSVNPVYIFPGALAENFEDVVRQYSSSCLSASGQFCTNPGLVILLQDEASEAFIEAVVKYFEAAPTEILLSSNAPTQLTKGIQALLDGSAELLVGGKPKIDHSFSFDNTLLQVSGEQFLTKPEILQTEAFGNVALVVLAKDIEQMVAITNSLEGNLTGTIYSGHNNRDEQIYQLVEPLLRQKVGRLLNDKMPTGVAVSPAMMHGGPFPSTGHPGFTSVGIPASMLRFGMLQSYDNVRQERLPVELRNVNPTGKTWRFIDGNWTTASI